MEEAGNVEYIEIKKGKRPEAKVDEEEQVKWKDPVGQIWPSIYN